MLEQSKTLLVADDDSHVIMPHVIFSDHLIDMLVDLIRWHD